MKETEYRPLPWYERKTNEEILNEAVESFKARIHEITKSMPNQNISRLRASHDQLLAAAKAVIPDIGMHGDRKELICIQAEKFHQLRSAIAAVEEHAP